MQVLRIDYNKREYELFGKVKLKKLKFSREGIVNKLLRSITFIMLFFSVMILISAIRNENVQLCDFPKETVTILWLGLILWWLIFTFQSVKHRLWKLLKKIGSFLGDHPKSTIMALMAVAIVVQSFLIFSFTSTPVTDVKYLLDGARDAKIPEIKTYLSEFPNQRLIFFIFYALARITPDDQTFLQVLQVLNMIMLVVALPIAYLIGKRLFNQRVGMIMLTLTFLLTSGSRIVLETYTDLPAYFLTLVIFLLSTLTSKIKYPLIGLTLGLTFLFKPSGIIWLIAFFLLVILKLFSLGFKSIIPEIIKLLFIIATFLSTILIFQIFDQQQKIISYDKNQAVNISTFLLYGISGDDDPFLTRCGINGPNKGYAKYGGLNVKDLDSKKKSPDQNLKLVRKRYRALGINGYLKHFLIKLKFTTRDGTFRDNDAFIFLSSQQKGVVAEIQAYFNDDHYAIYRIFLQLVWIVIIIGMIASCFGKKKPEIYLFQLSTIGLLLFLMIFEGGTGRYLIQGWGYFLILATVGYHNIFEKCNRCSEENNLEYEKWEKN